MFQAIFVTLIFSAIVNVLALASPLFMLAVYDRVLVSGSVPTLVALLTIALGMHMFSGFLDVVRGRMVNRIAAFVDHSLSQKAILAIYKLSRNEIHDSQRSSQDLDQLRAFLNSGGPLALADLPWIPLYLLICFFLHPYIGWLAALSALTLILSTGLTDVVTRGKNAAFAQATASRNRVGENAHRNSEIISALRMDSAIEKRWLDVHDRAVALHQQLSDRISFSTAFSKSIRYAIQTCTLALGAWLVLGGEITAGTIVAASTVVARALAPIEQSIANWRGMVAAWQAWSRLRSVRLAPTVPRTTLPAPRHYLKVDSAYVPAPGQERRLLLSNINFAAPSGNVIGIIGPSGSGKSTLLSSIVGTLPLASGRIELDGASLDQWDETLGVHIGYMPQHSELFEGSIAENICRLSETRDDGAIVAAAKAAGAHEMIVGLPNGYETRVIGGGDNLSGGQRQRIALARALYGEPFLIVLDEPNSNLDADGERALASAIKAVKARGGIVLLVAHRQGILEDVDYLLVLERGAAKAFGPRTGVLRAMRQEAVSRRPPDDAVPLAREEQDA